MKGERKRINVARLCTPEIVPEFWGATGEQFFSQTWVSLPVGVRAKATAKDLAELMTLLVATQRARNSEAKVVGNVRKVSFIAEQARRIGAFFAALKIERPTLPALSMTAARIIADVKLWGKR